MNELYWITRLDAVDTAFTTFLVISTIALVFTTIGCIVNKCEEIERPYKEEASKYKKLFIIYFKYSVIAFVFSLLGLIFIPNTKQALAIWGIGGTIDYIKANPTSKKLPDKCIKALDRWVDTIATDSIKEEKSTKK